MHRTSSQPAAEAMTDQAERIRAADDTMLEMGRLNPHGRFVHLYLNGAYGGLYHLRERWGAAWMPGYCSSSS